MKPPYISGRATSNSVLNPVIVIASREFNCSRSEAKLPCNSGALFTAQLQDAHLRTGRIIYFLSTAINQQRDKRPPSNIVCDIVVIHSQMPTQFSAVFTEHSRGIQRRHPCQSVSCIQPRMCRAAKHIQRIYGTAIHIRQIAGSCTNIYHMYSYQSIPWVALYELFDSPDII